MGRRAVRLDEADPKGLVRESYNIEGITLGECGSIFMDWALSLPVGPKDTGGMGEPMDGGGDRKSVV